MVRDNKIFEKDLIHHGFKRNQFLKSLKAKQKKQIPSLIKSFFNYAIDAAIHGYPLRFKNQSRGVFLSIMLKVYDEKDLDHEFLNRFEFSPKTFGKLFFIDVSSEIIKNHSYLFNLDREQEKKIIKLVESEKVYGLIKSKK